MDEIICNCKMVDKAEILEAIKLQAFPDLAYVQEKTEAGTTCRRCVPVLRWLIENYNQNNNTCLPNT